MDSPETTPIQPDIPPTIRHAPGLTLTAAEATLLARAFPDSQEIFVEREFRSGYSGAVVLLVSPGSGQAQVVVKLGSATEVQREYVAYRQYVKQASPQNTARLQGEPLLTDDEQLALLSYTFAGGDPRRPTNSLQAYYESKGGQATAAVLDRVFRTYGRQWWAINRPQKFVVSEQYDRLLPIHLKLKPAETVETNPHTLVAGQINATALRDLQPGQPVRLKGFRVAETRSDRQEVKLTANSPPGEASAPLRLRLETDDATPYRPGKQVEMLDAVVTVTRQSLLAEVAGSAFPAFDPEATHLTLNGRPYPNPLYNMSDLLDRVIETKVSTIHGDLNLQNILVDEETGFAWLIDFAETRLGPTLFDLQRLESQVIIKLLPPVIAQAGLEPVVVADLLESLHADPLSPTAPHTALQEPYTVLVTLRRLARQYLMDDRDWDEYYVGLVLTLVGSLKYPELEPLGRHLALVGSAIAQELIGTHLTRLSDMDDFSRTRKYHYQVLAPNERDRRNLLILLDKVRTFWIEGVLEKSLHGAALIALGLEERREAIDHPWNVILQIPGQSDQPLPSDTKIIDVFNKYGEALLILGEPGSGKTTMLLELARDIIIRAKEDPTHVIPIIFNLSSWTDTTQSLADWLVDELNAKYFIPKKMASSWVDNDQLLLLLDGLDEVRLEHREACVRATNEFRREHLVPLVVCSRVADYEQIDTQLRLNNAVFIKPLTPRQIDDYLSGDKINLEAVRATLKHDAHLQKLAQTPLMLTIMTLAYQGMSRKELRPLDTVEARRKHLFNAYIERMFERRESSSDYSQARARHWLAWLAQNMLKTSQTIFLIERMQPSWLSTQKQHKTYLLATRLILGLIVGLISSLFSGAAMGLIIGSAGGMIGRMIFGLIFGLVFGLVFGLIFGFSRGLVNMDTIDLAEVLKWSRKGAGKGLITGLGIGLIGGLTVGILAALISNLNSGMIIGSITGACIWLGSVLRLGLNPAPNRMDIQMRASPNQGIWQSGRNAMAVGLGSGVIAGLTFGIILGSIGGQIIGVIYGLIFGLTSALSLGLSIGGVSVIQHFTLRFILYLNGHLPWNLASFLNYAVDLIFLRKVGGGYIFVHRLLMEHFAEMEAE